MRINIEGHNYKYAVEQIMLAMFPEERPEYGSVDRVGLSAESRLAYGEIYAQAVTVIWDNSRAYRGYARVRHDRLTEKLTTDRLLQRIVKQSFYRAAVGMAPAPPVWGSLTGIRPAKLAAAALESGAGKKKAAKTLSRDFYVSPERAAICVDAALAAIAVKRSVEPDDIALYVGIPFCPTRCAYCSFVSNSVEKSFGLIEPFAQKLLAEIGAAAETVRKLGLRVIAVYIGGGTPTALPVHELEKILYALKTSFDLSNTREFTVEAGRPDTITPQNIEVIRGLGAGRICVNPQSMSPGVLSAIGRAHTPEDALSAAELVKRSGSILNMDVIAGLPGDAPEGFRATLDTVIGIGPENVTVHTLSLKKGSRIMLECQEIPGAADVTAMLEYASRRLRDAGYSPYYLYRQKYASGGFENVGWTLPGFEGIYNICMMEELCTILSLGGGAVTKLVSPGGRIERVFNAKYPREYIAQTEKAANKFYRIKEFYREIRDGSIEV
ncbi:MAG: coproporphyrinogen dehydrogenase HemZ [Oscillospiraceae bacterium]|jgi:oxygen-independent coproporphyrinogen-3 oxidase|nr:coproporphyrinogen dehydrogenase HemZ [Oscillospiraceae bacterium]